MQIDFEKEIKTAILHDLHKLKGRAHDSKHQLSTSADGDASKMSRPTRRGKIAYGDNVSNYRISLDGESLYRPGNSERNDICNKINRDYLTNDSAEKMYNRLLRCEVLSRFNESPDLETTSLKYHTVLVTNLHYNYLHGNKFSELHLGIVDFKNINSIFDAIFVDEVSNKYFTISSDTDNCEAIASLGAPMLNFGGVMSRLRGQVYLSCDSNIYSNLRRIGSWSTGLQYLEDSLSHSSKN